MDLSLQNENLAARLIRLALEQRYGKNWICPILKDKQPSYSKGECDKNFVTFPFSYLQATCLA